MPTAGVVNRVVGVLLTLGSLLGAVLDSPCSVRQGPGFLLCGCLVEFTCTAKVLTVYLRFRLSETLAHKPLLKFSVLPVGWLIHYFSTKPGSIETNPALVVEVPNVEYISI